MRSAAAGVFLGPICLALIFALTRIERRASAKFDVWSKRIQHEIAQWS
jgi:hypothetical protein